MKVCRPRAGQQSRTRPLEFLGSERRISGATKEAGESAGYPTLQEVLQVPPQNPSSRTALHFLTFEFGANILFYKDSTTERKLKSQWCGLQESVVGL